MTESQKALLGFLIVICGFIAFFAWAADFVSPLLTWAGRIVAPTVATGAIATLIWAGRKKDEVPDFIRQQGIQPFERDGFSFTFLPRIQEGTLSVRMLFQNSYDRQCNAQIVCKPIGFWLQKISLSPFTVEIICPPAGYGTADVLLAVPQEYQGKQIRYEVGADIDYPDGHGRRLRHKTGVRVGKPVFTNRFRAILSVFGVFAGFHLGRPASFRMMLPQGVATQFTEPTHPQINHLWKLGDQTANNVLEDKGQMTADPQH